MEPFDKEVEHDRVGAEHQRDAEHANDRCNLCQPYTTATTIRGFGGSMQMGEIDWERGYTMAHDMKREDA